jgi:hypothetical protein
LLTPFAVIRPLAKSTRTQALAAVLFLYRHVLEQPLGSLEAVRMSKPAYLGPSNPAIGRCGTIPGGMRFSAGVQRTPWKLVGVRRQAASCCDSGASIELRRPSRGLRTDSAR